ncbi:MAG: hypothetical protein JW999_04230 [Methanotrichaceae archaeon]|nr:hypothetical protein [Methanotrichaceae archaeon]
MARIDGAIEKLERILDCHICFSRREDLGEVLNLLKEEHESRKSPRLSKDDNNSSDASSNNISDKLT